MAESLEALTERLARAEVEVGQALAFGGVGVWAWDLATNALWWDKTMYANFGVDQSDTVSTYEDFISRVLPHDVPAVESRVHACIERDEPYNYFFRVRRADGVYWIHGSGNVARDAGGRAMTMIGVTIMGGPASEEDFPTMTPLCELCPIRRRLEASDGAQAQG